MGLFRNAKPDTCSTNPSIQDLEKAILILKLAFSRYNAIIDSVPQDSDVRNLLFGKRAKVRRIIEALQKAKSELSLSSPPPCELLTK